MKKCAICGKEAENTIDPYNFSDYTGTYVQGEESTYLCDEHHKEAWKKIDRQEGCATLIAVLVTFCTPVLFVGWLLYVIFSWLF